MRILELRAARGRAGSADRAILQAAARHDPDEIDVTLGMLRRADDSEFDLDRLARELGLQHVEEILERGALGFGSLRAVARLIADRRIDLLHTHERRGELLAWLLRRRRSKPAYLATVHDAPSPARARVIRRFDRIVTVSDTIRDRLVELGVPADRIEPLHEAVDEERWSRANVRSSLREELGVQAWTPLVGTVARLDADSEVPSFLAVARRVGERFAEARFVVVGEGPLRDELAAQAAGLGLGERTLFTGRRSDLPELFAALDALVLLSGSEGTPRLLLQAMSMGLATVGTRLGANGEIVSDGEDGYLCEPGDVDAIARRVEALLGDRALADGLGAAARHTVETRFSLDARTRRLAALYRELAG